MGVPIETTVRNFISSNLTYGEEAEVLSTDASLLDAGLIDSTAILELVAFLEDTFAIEIADGDLVPDNLDSISRIAAYVRRTSSNANAAAREAIRHGG